MEVDISDDTPASNADTSEDIPVINSEEQKTAAQIKGLPKSGRWWKETRNARHSAVVKVKPLKSSWEKKMADKAKMKQAKLLQQEIRERQLQEKQERIERKKEQEKRRLENERKGEVVQVIKNTAKLRKVKKKQLRMIEKRDTN
ncbi:Coiled-coil domain-containing protein 86 [Trichostrongylus colubriformis]|uniref:Coiled-coil domain-containing protein 86 n=1 Tax=Trichostrongylus colubriformis TaxID=6319 RepID=A0AAN8FNR1_TRICO